MSIGARIAIVTVLGAVAAVVVEIVAPGGRMTALVVIAGGVAIGELVAMRPRHREPVPLGYAPMLVLIRAFSPLAALVAIVAAEIVVVPLRPEGTLGARIRTSAEHAAAGAAGLLVFHLLLPLALLGETPWMLTTLAVSSVTTLSVHEGFVFARTRRVPPVGGADLALIASAMLMAIGFRAVGGHESVGLWGVGLFAVPLLAAWYSFERLAVISRTSEQTIEALSVVPEMAGLAAEGHAARVAELSVRVGDELGLRRRALDDLRAAALLHHLGHLCLDAPEVRDEPIEPYEVADQSAAILRQTDLASAGDLLATESVSVGGQVLRLASAYDDLRADHDVESALDALGVGPGFLYDRRVFDALERVVSAGASTAALAGSSA